MSGQKTMSDSQNTFYSFTIFNEIPAMTTKRIVTKLKEAYSEYVRPIKPNTAGARRIPA